MGLADLHIHSVHSHDGTCSISAILKYVADETDLDVIAITDHDKVSGLREAVALGPKYGIDVIPGCEISTAHGHLLALFIDRPIPAGLSVFETIRRVGKMGGLCVAPHPDAPGGGLRGSLIRAAVADPEMANVMVGVETFNSGLVFPRSNLKAQVLGRDLGLACLGASDAHTLSMIGLSATEFEGRTALDVRAALEAHATSALSIRHVPGPLLLGHWIPKFFLRKVGWVAWNEEPEAPLSYIRTKYALSGALAK